MYLTWREWWTASNSVSNALRRSLTETDGTAARNECTPSKAKSSSKAKVAGSGCCRQREGPCERHQTGRAIRGFKPIAGFDRDDGRCRLSRHCQVASLGCSPRKKPICGELTEEQIAYNHAFSQRRIIVETIINRLRRYQCLTQMDRQHRRHHTARVCRGRLGQSPIAPSFGRITVRWGKGHPPSSLILNVNFREHRTYSKCTMISSSGFLVMAGTLASAAG